jgi:DNA-binding MarR family transcriptional regulator
MIVTERMAVVTKRLTSAQLADALRVALTRLTRRLRQTRPMGELTQNQISVLASLELAGALTPRELAEAERVQPPTMTKVLARLEDRGMVQRAPHPTDGRQVLLSATAQGRAVLGEARRVKAEWLTARLGQLSQAERDILAQATEILDKLARD